MHPYCLKLHVEKEEESRNHSLFSQEEVWKYERPTEQESHEEINVVSDEEAPATETKREDRLGRVEGRPLKSALLNRNRARSTRERKRVSFGPVHVALFGESEGNQTSETKSETLEVQTLTPDRDDNVGQQREKKGRALSLQEYRQLRQNKRPLVEKQGDYTTKWPSVSETPKELTPIFCFQGQKQNPCRPKSTPLHPESSSSSLRAPNPAQSKPRSRLKGSEPRTISPASLLPDNTPDPNLVLLDGKRSPVKKQTLLNVDPPNPVLLPVPSSSSQSTCSQETPNKSSAAPPQDITSPAHKEFNIENTAPSQEGKSSPTKRPPAQTRSRSPKSSPGQNCPPPVLSRCPPPLTQVSQSPPEEPPPPQTDCKQPRAAVESGNI